MKPEYPVSKEEAEKQIAYYRAEFMDGCLMLFEKHLNGQVDGRQEYSYYPTGVIRESRTFGEDGRLTHIQTFDESGDPVDSR